jgi:hypothetical protein
MGRLSHVESLIGFIVPFLALVLTAYIVVVQATVHEAVITFLVVVTLVIMIGMPFLAFASLRVRAGIA